MNIGEKNDLIMLSRFFICLVAGGRIELPTRGFSKVKWSFSSTYLNEDANKISTLCAIVCS